MAGGAADTPLEEWVGHCAVPEALVNGQIQPAAGEAAATGVFALSTQCLQWCPEIFQTAQVNLWVEAWDFGYPPRGRVDGLDQLRDYGSACWETLYLFCLLLLPADVLFGPACSTLSLPWTLRGNNNLQANFFYTSWSLLKPIAILNQLIYSVNHNLIKHV